MAGLSDVLGGVYNDDDPTPDQHEATALEERPVADEAEAATVWDVDDDSDGDETEQVDDDEVVVRVFVHQGDDNDDVDEAAAVTDEENAMAEEPGDDEEPGTPVWNLDSPVDDQEIDWTPEAPVPWDQVAEPETNGHAPEVAPADEDDATDEDKGITTRSFGMLAAGAAAGDEDVEDGPAPWLRADDDILPAKKKKGLFRRR
ncbi:MAG: hypothetical protein AAGA99_15330 [Actinomycetota bacterium]